MMNMTMRRSVQVRSTFSNSQMRNFLRHHHALKFGQDPSLSSSIVMTLPSPSAVLYVQEKKEHVTSTPRMVLAALPGWRPELST